MRVGCSMTGHRHNEFAMEQPMNRPLSGTAPSADDLRLIDAWWRAANYLSVGQIYLLDNPLLGRPIERADLKPPGPERLAGDQAGSRRMVGEAFNLIRGIWADENFVHHGKVLDGREERA